MWEPRERNWRGHNSDLLSYCARYDWVLEEVLWQWNKCDNGRLQELAAASINSAHMWFVSGHSLLAEQQQAGAAVQVSRQPCLGSALPAHIWGSPYKRLGKEKLALHFTWLTCHGQWVSKNSSKKKKMKQIKFTVASWNYKHSWMVTIPWKKNSFYCQRAGKVLSWCCCTSGD